MLKGNHRSTQDEWLWVWNNYEQVLPREHIESLIDKTATEMYNICKGKDARYSWSGGKDSIAMQIVGDEVGIKGGYRCYSSLYFTKSIQFFWENKPAGVEMYDSGEDMEWLSKHPEYLFPSKPFIWDMQTHLKYQPIFCKKTGTEILLMGKRTQDGNNVGKDIVSTNKKGVSIYCPIRNWTHEEVICAIRYRNRKISSIYFDRDGFSYGDTVMARMNPLPGETLNDAWDRIYSIEPQKVLDAAEYGIRGATEYLAWRMRQKNG